MSFSREQFAEFLKTATASDPPGEGSNIKDSQGEMVPALLQPEFAEPTSKDKDRGPAESFSSSAEERSNGDKKYLQDAFSGFGTAAAGAEKDLKNLLANYGQGKETGAVAKTAAVLDELKKISKR
jgi:hypothetical protein